MSTEDHSISEYQLTLVAVKMKVKFPCKMKLQHSSNSITEQVSSNDNNKFIFNQEVAIQQEADKQSFDINIVLITEKGAKYVSGVMKLIHSQLERSQGEKVECPLIKCLDNEAYCQLRINRVKRGKATKRISVSSSLVELKKLNNFQRKSTTEQNQLLSPRSKKNLPVQTRSQFGFGGINGRFNHDWDQTRSKGAAQTLIYKSSFLKSPKVMKSFAMGNSKVAQQFNNQYEVNSQRDKLSESQVYKEGYQKLKQKYKKQSEQLKLEQSKRVQLETNENNYKIQIMRLKLKSQEQERIIIQKNQKVKDLQITISEIQKQQLDIGYLKEENNNLEHKISQLNDSINSMVKENQVIKKLNLQRSQGQHKIINELRHQLEQSKQRLQKSNLEFSETIKQKTHQMIVLSGDIKSKISQIELQKHEIHKLQTHVQNKIYEFEKTLQNQKNLSNQLSNQLKQKIILLEKEKQQLDKELSDVKNDKQKIKSSIMKAEYDRKILMEEQKVMKNELLEYKLLKQKCAELQRQFTFISQDKINLQKQLHAINESKQINILEIHEQTQIKINYYKKQLKDMEEKVKFLSSSKIDLQSQIEVGKNTVDKQKRQHQSLISEIGDLKNKIKNMKQYSNNLQKKNLALENEISILNNKVRFGQQTFKVEGDRYKQSYERTKLQLTVQTARFNDLSEVRSKLQIEVGKNKIQLQYAEEKIDKLFTNNKQLQSNLQYILKEHQTQKKEYESLMKRQLAQIAQKNDKINKYEHQSMNGKEKQINLTKQLKLADEKIINLQSIIKNNRQQYNQFEGKYKDLEKQYNKLQDEFHHLKHDNQLLVNEKIKITKIIDLNTVQMNEQKDKYKKLYEYKDNLQKIESELRNEIKTNQENYTKLEMKLKSVDREYNRFKQTMQKTIKSEFSKIPTLNNQVQSNGTSLTNDINPLENSDSILKLLAPQEIVAHLLGNITNSKQTLFKLVEHNKQLKNEIDLLKQQNVESSHKFQFSQLELCREVQQLSQELNEIYNSKEQEMINNEKSISDLNFKIHEKDNIIEQLKNQCQQLEYALSTLKVDFQTNNTQNDKKVNFLKQSIDEMQNKGQFLKVALSNQQDTNHDLQQKLELLKSQKQEQTQINNKNKIVIQQLVRQKDLLQKSYETILKQRKGLIEKSNQLQIQLTEQKQLKNQLKKTQQIQQKKYAELNEFVSSLMKQKENIIKSDLQKGERILELQNKQNDMKRDAQILEQQLQRFKSQLEQIKEKYRKENIISKNLNNELNEAKNKIKKIEERYQQKQKQIIMKDEIISRVDKKYRQLSDKNYKQTLQLHSDIDSKYNQNIHITKELNQKIALLSSTIQQLQYEKAKQHHQNVIVSDELLAEKQHGQLLKKEISNLQGQFEQITEQCKSLQHRNILLCDQIQEKQQQLSQFNDKVIVLQAELEALTKDKNLKLQELNSDWIRKYQSIIGQYQQKLSSFSNQKQLIRSQLQEKINQLEQSLNQNKNNELGTLDMKKNYEQKVKKLQSDRLSTILSKNNEIKKLTEETKHWNDSQKKLENLLREQTQMIENTRRKLIDEQKARKQAEDKLKTHLRVHQAEVGNMAKKEAYFKTQTQKLYQSVFSNERQVRKVVQNYLKKILDQCDNAHIDKITNVSKGLESLIINAMRNNINNDA